MLYWSTECDIVDILTTFSFICSFLYTLFQERITNCWKHKKQINLGLGNLYLGCFNGICVQAQWRWSFWLSYFYAWWELGINNPSFHSVVYNCNHTHANKEFYNSCYLRRCVCVKLVTNGDRDGHVLKDIILFQILVQLMRSCSAILYSLNWSFIVFTVFIQCWVKVLHHLSFKKNIL